MDDSDILEELFQEKMLVSLEFDYDKSYKVSLIEEGVTRPVVIRKMPPDSIVVRSDLFPSPKLSVFLGNKGEGKRSDFMIISESKRCVLIVELKKTGKGENKNIVFQLKGTKCFFLYCKAIGRTFWQKDDFLEGYEERYVIFKKIYLPKTRVKIKKGEKPDKMFFDGKKGENFIPEKALKINHPNITLEFAHLV